MPIQNHTYRLAALYPLHPKPYTLKNFTFSAKERDTETGLSYFGSRYYSSDLSIWLSVDPQAAKYPSLSNYVYCSNNPIKVIDPNGEDEYEFDGAGNMTNVKQSQYDSFHKIDEDGNRTGESIFFNRKIVTDEITIEGKNRNSSYLKINNANDAENVFSFISEKVEREGGEFSNSVVKDQEGNVFNLIGSDINATRGELYTIPNLLSSDKYSVIESTHNHYGGKVSPSGPDVYYAKKYPETNFMIRTLGNYCTPYDGNTPADYDLNTSGVSIPLKIINVHP